MDILHQTQMNTFSGTCKNASKIFLQELIDGQPVNG